MAYQRDEEDEESKEHEDSESKAEEKKEEKKARPAITSRQWWRSEELGKEPHEILDNVVKQIEDDQSSRYEAYREYERLFGASVRAEGDDSFAAVATDELTQNELQNTIETLWAQVFKNKIVPAVSASEADWEEWDRARSYSRWLEGAFKTAKVHAEHMPQAGAHSLVHGTGILRVGWKEVGKKTAQITCWAVNPRYVCVDRLEGKHGKPRNIFFKDHIDRWSLWEMYGCEDDEYYGDVGKRRHAIETCTSNDDLDLGVTNLNSCDMLTVREAFHLPSGPGADDGCHVIWIRNCTLMKRKFTWDRLPATFIRYGVRMEGFYGESAERRIAPTQKNLDKLTKKIDESQDIMGVPRILVQLGSGLKKTHVDDIPGGILEVNNINQVRDWNAQCATPELYNDRDAAGHKMRALLGVSDFEAQQQIPQGMRDVSGAFLERWVEQGQARHAMFHGDYEEAVTDLADLFMRQAEECQELGYDMVVHAKNSSKSGIETLRFKDVRVDRERLKIEVQPMSQLPQTFAGKVEAITKLKDEAGVPVDPKTILRMLEIPDLQGTTDMMVSDEEIIMKNLDHMVKKGEYLPPLPFDNLDLIVQLTTRFINRYRIRNDADNEVVGLLAQYIDDAILLKKGLGAPDPNAPPGMAAIGPGPGGVPPAMGPSAPGAPPGPPGGPPMALAPGLGPAPAPPGPGPAGMPPGPPGPPMM